MVVGGYGVLWLWVVIECYDWLWMVIECYHWLWMVIYGY